MLESSERTIQEQSRWRPHQRRDVLEGLEQHQEVGYSHVETTVRHDQTAAAQETADCRRRLRGNVGYAHMYMSVIVPAPRMRQYLTILIDDL
jgi:hypothetical protein